METVLQAVEDLRRERAQVLIAVDGPCASGKSTFGRQLEQALNCPLFHMDDYFLPPSRKTAHRLAQPGGNVDWERFQEEILLPLTQGREVRMRPYCCRSGRLEEERVVPPSHLSVVEGVYALHPVLRPAYDLRIFLTCDWTIRRERLLLRGGPALLSRFETEWIPLEDAYFEAAQVQNCCQLILDGGAPMI